MFAENNQSSVPLQLIAIAMAVSACHPPLVLVACCLLNIFYFILAPSLIV